MRLAGTRKKINFWVRTTNRIWFVIWLTVSVFLIALVANCIIELFRDKDIIWYQFPYEEQNLIVLFIVTVLIAPVFETFLNQYLPYYLLSKITYLNERKCIILISSSIFFGLIHFYSLFYMLYGFVMGLIFMYAYMERIKTDIKTFYLITLSHFLFNLGVFLKTII